MALARRFVIDRHRQALQRTRLVDARSCRLEGRRGGGAGIGGQAAGGELDRPLLVTGDAQFVEIEREAGRLLEVIEGGTGEALTRPFERHRGGRGLAAFEAEGAGRQRVPGDRLGQGRHRHCDQQRAHRHDATPRDRFAARRDRRPIVGTRTRPPPACARSRASWSPSGFEPGHGIARVLLHRSAALAAQSLP